MTATWYFMSCGPAYDQEYTWLPAGAGSPADAYDILRIGYGGRPCSELVDDELPGMLLYSERGRLVLLVTALMPAGRPADHQQRAIRVSLIGVAASSDEPGCRALVGVAAEALLQRIAGRLPMRYDAALPSGFSVGPAWLDVTARAASRLTGLAGRAAPADARGSVLAPDTEQYRAALAAELSAAYLNPGLGGLRNRIIVLRTSKLEQADFDRLWPWRALSPATGTVTELHQRSGHGEERTLPKLAGDVIEFLRNSMTMTVVITGIAVVGGGISAAVALQGGRLGGHQPHHPKGAVAPSAAFAVYVWGATPGGNPGDGTTRGASTGRPIGVTLPAGMTMPATSATASWHLAAGARHSLALTAAGQVLAWGSNTDGQLGDGTTVSRPAPVPVPMTLPAGVTVSAVSAGCSQSLALTSAGRVLAWGGNGSGQIAQNPKRAIAKHPLQVHLPGKASAISAGCSDSMALVGGKIFTWGANQRGQLGDGTRKPHYRPVRVKLPPGVTHIAAGCSFGLALARDGTLYAWGQGSHGQLGNGTRAREAVTPIKVVIPAALMAGQVTATAAGCDYALALTSSGKLLAWGDDSVGQLGVSGASGARDVPAVVSLPSATVVRQICAGADFSLALTAGGQVLAWGSDSVGQLGLGPDAGPTPVATDLRGVIVAIGAGSAAEHALAIRQPGRG